MDKNTLITSGVYEEFKKLRNVLYAAGLDRSDKLNYTRFLGIEETNKCFSIYNSVKQRKNRSKGDILKWVFAIQNIPSYKNYKIVFGTLTFTDKVLANTSKETRRRYIARFLNKYAVHYKANVDYGEKNHREHYHFIAFIQFDIPITKWEYGTQHQVREVQLDKDNIEIIKAYLLKLNNHSFKGSTKQEKLICDKNKRDMLESEIDLIFYEPFRAFKLLYS